MYVQNSRAVKHKETKSFWEKDYDNHGGKQWKFWPDRGSWEKKEEPSSIWDDGRVRKPGKSGGLPVEWRMYQEGMD